MTGRNETHVIRVRFECARARRKDEVTGSARVGDQKPVASARCGGFADFRALKVTAPTAFPWKRVSFIVMFLTKRVTSRVHCK